MPRRVFITVAEVSGDHHAAALAAELRRVDPDIILEGHGGSAMRAAGVTIHHETVQRATMLLRAVVRAGEFWKLLRWTNNYFHQNRPDLHICIDSSGVNLHFAKMARSCGVPVLYYIAPQLWASREGRIRKVQQYVNRVACILPFEEEYYQRRGVTATFVGHPLFDELPPNRMMSPEPMAFQAGDEHPAHTDTSSESNHVIPPVQSHLHGLEAHATTAPSNRSPVVGLMPGSRRGEVRANWPPMLDVADRIRAVYPAARFEVPTTPPTHELVVKMAGNRPDLRIEQGAIDAMVPRWDFCIAKSGTTTLHVAAYGVPMIVVYRVSSFAYHLVARWVVKTPSIALVNILAERSSAQSGVPRYRIVPEIIPWNGSNEPVANLAIQYLQHPEKRQDQRNNLLKLISTLDHRGASEKVAKIVLEMINPPAPR
jgi:lipid-A-disaccharide synthase